MNIEELFDNEMYHNYGMLTTDDANLLTNYLKEEVMEYVAGLQKRIADLEKRLVDANKTIAELKQVLYWLDTQGGLGYEKHAEIKRVLGRDA